MAKALPKIVKRFKFLSKSGKRKGDKHYHTTVVESNGNVACSCPGATYAGKCWHKEWVIDVIPNHYSIV